MAFQLAFRLFALRRGWFVIVALMLLASPGRFGLAQETAPTSTKPVSANPVAASVAVENPEPPLAANDSKEDELQIKKERDDYYELLMTFADTIDQIDRNYVEKVSRREILEAAIEGVLRKLDPNSDYINPDDIDEFKLDVENKFVGVGLQVNRRDDRLQVISPVVGTPAYRAGIVAGDEILAIDGQPTKDFSVDDVVKRLQGKVGSFVSITLFHPRTGVTEEVRLKRESIKLKTVLGDRRKTDGSWKYMYDDSRKIGYVRITIFGRETADELRTALRQLKSDGLRGLILDLRFNSGGLLSAAIEVGDLFLSHGKIVSTQGRNITPQSWDAVPENTYEGFPMVVLVNEYSASASEIVAAALQDHQRAVVVGQQTYGKASVQNVIELEGGRSALKLTTGSYQRPSGKPIHRFPDASEWGVQPNETFDVPLSDQELQRLIRKRYERDNEINPGSTAATPSFDRQFKRALLHLQSETEKVESKR